MSITRKIAQLAEAVKDSVKKMAGRISGSRRLRTEAPADQVKGS
jgi:uncharacterized protein YjbJ (UPF0337 family)